MRETIRVITCGVDSLLTGRVIQGLLLAAGDQHGA